MAGSARSAGVGLSAERSTGASGAPQSPQNFAMREFSLPHFGHRNGSAVPHCAQNFLASGFSVPHFGQSMAFAIGAHRRCSYQS